MNFSFLSSATKTAANSVNEILADFQDKIDQLKTLADIKISDAEELNRQAGELLAQSKDANDEAARAMSAAGKIQSLFNIED